MLKMITGAHIPTPERLTPSYMLSDGCLTANVNADDILPLINSFIDLHEGPFLAHPPPGESVAIELEGHTAADAIDVLKSIGLYFAEQREE